MHICCPVSGIGKVRVKNPGPWKGTVCVWLWHSHSCLGQGAFRHIPHSKGLGSSKWHLRWSSRECRCQMQSQIRSFSQKYPVQTCTHSCCPAQQQTLLPGQSSGYGVGQMSGWNNNIVSDNLKTPSGPHIESMRQQTAGSFNTVRAPAWESGRSGQPTLVPGSEITFASIRNFT